MGLDAQQYYKVKFKAVYMSDVCYVAACGLVLSEIFIVVSVTSWLLYGVGLEDFVLLFCCVWLAYGVPKWVWLLEKEREYVCKLDKER